MPVAFDEVTAETQRVRPHAMVRRPDDVDNGNVVVDAKPHPDGG